jgi:uroporphyrin-III C-methyltransferase
MKGKVYLVGAGPGDPKLITLHGLEAIKKADVIAYDRLVNDELLSYAKESAELVYCGKLPGKHALIQDQINDLLVTKALDGKIVTRLKGGDPCVFGRVGEEAEILEKNGIEFQIVPGVTSGIAAPAYAGIPVTHRDFGTSSFAIVTAHGRDEKGEDRVNWKALAEGIDTISFYMGVGNLPHICERLMHFGRSKHTPVAVIQWGTTKNQITVIGTLETIERQVAEKQITHPAMITVGDVVSLHGKLDWFGRKQEE